MCRIENVINLFSLDIQFYNSVSPSMIEIDFFVHILAASNTILIPKILLGDNLDCIFDSVQFFFVQCIQNR